MVCISFLKCTISNKMDGTEDDALYEDFLGEGFAETEEVADSDGYTDYYDDFLATREIPDYGWASFFMDDKNYSNLRDFNHIIDRIFFETGKPILQKSTLTYTVGICRRMEFQGKKVTSTYLLGRLIHKYLQYITK